MGLFKLKLKKLKKELHPKEIWKRIKAFFKVLPTRLWLLYIETLLVPNYRNEWGKYNGWNCRTAVRPERNLPPLIKMTKEGLKRRRTIVPFMKYEPRSHNSHDHSKCSRIRINVSGRVYETQVRTLEKFPKTLLGNPQLLIRFYDPVNEEYFFDRHRDCFEFILFYYQSGGVLFRPLNIEYEIFKRELTFYMIDAKELDANKEGKKKKDLEQQMPQNHYLRKLWLLFEYPESSSQAKICGIISLFVIVVSIMSFIAQTLPHFKEPNNDVALNLKDIFFDLESICTLWFCCEFIVRAICSPNISDFTKETMNIVDFLSIVPYFVTLIEHWLNKEDGTELPFEILRIFRLTRVFRIFKLSRHSKGLKILGKTLKASLNELFLLCFFLFVGVILFSSGVYFAEIGQPGTNFTSIPAGFWWAVITMTTVGYGDIVPITLYGKIIGSLCVIAGVLTISLPVPVIVSNFNYYYLDETEKFIYLDNKFVSACPYLPGTGLDWVEKPTKAQLCHDILKKNKILYEKMQSRKRMETEEKFGLDQELIHIFNLNANEKNNEKD